MKAVHYKLAPCGFFRPGSPSSKTFDGVTCRTCSKLGERRKAEADEHTAWWDSAPFDSVGSRERIMLAVLFDQKWREATGEGSALLDWYDGEPTVPPPSIEIPDEQWEPVIGRALGFAAIMTGAQSTIRYADAH